MKMGSRPVAARPYEPTKMGSGPGWQPGLYGTVGMGSGFDGQPNPLLKDGSCRAGLKKSGFFGEAGLL